MKHLSRFDIEAIADKYVQAYMALPDVRNTQIYRIDPELLLEGSRFECRIPAPIL